MNSRVNALRARIDQLRKRLPRLRPPPGEGLGGVDFSSLSNEELVEMVHELSDPHQLDELIAEAKVRHKLATGELLPAAKAEPAQVQSIFKPRV
jgi:hypothetical protein